MRPFFALFAVARLASICGVCCAVRWTPGQSVHTTSGTIYGRASPNASDVSEYLGIPYALPPVGKLRFQAPVRFNSTLDINATSFGFACIPSNTSATDAEVPKERIAKLGITPVGLDMMYEVSAPDIQFSEDCLTLNIWAKPQVGEKQKAVLIWIHGGTFVAGSSSIPSYNGKYLASEQDLIIVSINYRLTLFGFPGSPRSPSNPGLLDQRLAVEWVRDNIAAFGGDPSRIVIMGESAGGASVDCYSRAWPCDPIVQGLISMSGTSSGLGIRSRAEAERMWYSAASAAGCLHITNTSHYNASSCSAIDDDKVHTCMLGKSAWLITQSLTNVMDSPIRIPYGPTVDENIVFTPTTARYNTTARVPLLIGNTDNEYGFLRLFSDLPLTDEDWRNLNQEFFVCPAAQRAATSIANGNPTWRYRYMADFTNMEVSTNPKSGAYHESEMRQIFNTVKQDFFGKSTHREIEFGRYMRSLWAAFTKDTVNGLEMIGWPRYEGRAPTLARLGLNNRAGLHLAKGNMYDWRC